MSTKESADLLRYRRAIKAVFERELREECRLGQKRRDLMAHEVAADMALWIGLTPDQITGCVKGGDTP